MGGSNVDDVGCTVMHDPNFEQRYGFERQVFEIAGMMCLWIGSDSFDKTGVVLEMLSPSYTVGLELLIQSLRHWRHCIFIGPKNDECRGSNIRFCRDGVSW